MTNLAHGGVYLLGGYVALSVQRTTGNWLVAILAGFIFSGGIGIALYLLLRRLRGEGLRETMVTLGAAIVMADQALARWGGVPSDLDPPAFLRGSLPLPASPLMYPKFRIAVIGLAVLAGLVLWLLLYRTRLGMVIRAGVDDQDMVSMAGIRVELVFCAVFILAGGLAGMAGVAGGTYLSLAQGEDNRILLASLIVVIAGGLGSLRGAGAAAILVGLVEAFAQTHHAILSVLITFGTLIAVLALRPHGLFGQPIECASLTVTARSWRRWWRRASGSSSSRWWPRTSCSCRSSSSRYGSASPGQPGVVDRPGRTHLARPDGDLRHSRLRHGDPHPQPQPQHLAGGGVRGGQRTRGGDSWWASSAVDPPGCTS